jgi:hypothetical protein
MKTEISARISAMIHLEPTEQFEVVGADEYGSIDYKIIVERVSHWNRTYPEASGVKFSGRRVLKDGSTNYQTKSVVLVDGDDRIPEDIAAAVKAMRERAAFLRAYIAEEA